MRRELHVRFSEGGGVQFPSATRLLGARVLHGRRDQTAAWSEPDVS